MNLLVFRCIHTLLCPLHRRGGGGIRRSSASVVRLSVCLMSHTLALTRKPKGLGRRNFAQGYPRSHATPTPTSRLKGQKSRSRGGGISWRRPSRTACLNVVCNHSKRRRCIHVAADYNDYVTHDLKRSKVSKYDTQIRKRLSVNGKK